MSKRFLLWMMLSSLVVLSGCQTTGRSSTAVGPSVGPTVATPLGEEKKNYNINSNIFLDVAIPVFDPGIPEDLDKLEKDSIWPQLRRAEANRFSLMTKEALQKTGVFGSVSVAPSPQVTSELYVLGKIIESNSEDVEISIEVVDISGRRWGKETFKHRVSPGFYRDKRNDGEDSYGPIFEDIADHVVSLLKRKREAQKEELKHIADIRFAQSFSPEAFSQHITTDRNGYVSLVSLPAENDPAYSRIRPLRVQDQLFLDRIQSQYEGFSAKVDESYLTWQEETLPVILDAKKAKRQSVARGILGAVLIGAAVAGAVDSDSSGLQDVATVGAAIGGGLLVKSALDKNREAKVHSATIDELGESLDIEIDPQLVELEDKTIELTGTAQEQYTQWKSHLKKIYELEQTPDVEL
ncbi:hypothetical protein EYS14_17840 [Alteromonadaceae bacterium M269]|nr:hypothetical protein EYS14_17840 [Alteromonadaceae bacterium M269]